MKTAYTDRGDCTACAIVGGRMSAAHVRVPYEVVASQRPANNTRPPRISRKAWSAKDADHIPKGRRVMIIVDPEKLHPTIASVRVALSQSVGGMSAPTQRYGVVERRWVDGAYLVQLEDSRWGITFPRSALLYPIPPNVTALEVMKP